MASLTSKPVPTGFRAMFGRGIALVGNMAGTRHGAIGAVILLLLSLIAILAPVLAPYHPLQQTAQSLAPPSRDSFGTDNIGRDIFSLILYGAQSSLLVGLGAALAALLVGGTIGILAGYFRGPVEVILMRVIELFQTLQSPMRSGPWPAHPSSASWCCRRSSTGPSRQAVRRAGPEPARSWR